MFLHSTGRCGSTLLSKVLGVLANVHSLSEPDIYGSIACHIALKTPGFDNELAKKLIRASTVLWTASIKSAKPETDIIAFKHRAFVTLHTDTFTLAVPEAKVCSVFPLRPALPFIAAMCSVSASLPVSQCSGYH
jgi:hypothetical protein